MDSFAPTIPTPLAHRHRQAQRRAGAITLVLALACTLTPVAWVLLPLAAAQAWRRRARAAAFVGVLAWIAAAPTIVDLRAAAAYPPLLTGPWITLVAGVMATSAAWASSARRTAAELLRAAALLALAASPWSPLPALIIALGCLLAAPHRPRPRAANDNDAGGWAIATTAIAPLSFPARRSARPAAYD
ncbi:hypothetical protein [uncultured Sphingomonas sp.]|uniref:hypothetical protein n=1 Tax=uncultured Sphingomonas sp. TaxID=158754 RepID=UPI002632B4CE|nr:hypothetical protein [uncultured Sphingomonas sp.]